MYSIIKPPKLKEGSNIRIVAPAWAPDIKDLSKGIEILKHLGFKVSLGKNIKRLAQVSYLSAPDKDRASELMDAFKDDTVDAIFCGRGGYGAMRILPYLDFDVIKEHPKIFMGYSDITALHVAINNFSHLITFHGPMPGTDVDEMRKPIFKTYIGMLKGENRDVSPPIERLIKYVVSGKATGISMGTNFSLIASLVGTKYLKDVKGKILFLEDVSTTAWDIDRYFATLELAGLLNDFEGFVFGDFTDIPKTEDATPVIEEIVEYHMGIANKPSLYGFPFGHGDEQTLIPLNAKISISSEPPYIELLEDVVA
ncbi:MAG: S66 peptidase family protein [Candidatus Micrarchaeia archaeon]|jgi:muramoyltetrapeptide carboxypeptidase